MHEISLGLQPQYGLLHLQPLKPASARWENANNAAVPSAAPPAKRVKRPKKPRRDTLTLVAAFSAARLIFSNMMNLLRIGSW
jgi:hypothetical protein